MCWASSILMKELEEIEILPSTLADHNPIILKLSTQKKRWTWRLNTEQLKDENLVKQMMKEMKVFFKQNIQP